MCGIQKSKERKSKKRATAGEEEGDQKQRFSFGAYPGAVMVESLDAVVTVGAVLGAGRPLDVARGAVLGDLPVRRLIRSKRDILNIERLSV